MFASFCQTQTPGPSHVPALRASDLPPALPACHPSRLPSFPPPASPPSLSPGFLGHFPPCLDVNNHPESHSLDGLPQALVLNSQRPTDAPTCPPCAVGPWTSCALDLKPWSHELFIPFPPPPHSPACSPFPTPFVQAHFCLRLHDLFTNYCLVGLHALIHYPRCNEHAIVQGVCPSSALLHGTQNTGLFI